MAFCRQCGNQMDDNTAFCTNCGAPQRAGTNTMQAISTNPLFNEVIEIMKGMLTKPITTVRNATMMEMPVCGAVAGAVALLTGLLTMWLTSALSKSIDSLIRDIVGFGMGSSSHLPMGDIFFYTIITTLVVMGGMFLGLLLMGKLMFKIDVPPQTYLNVSVATQVPFTATLIIATIMAYIYAPLGLATLAMGSIFGMICVFLGLEQIVNSEDNKLVFAVPLAYLVMWFVLYLAVRIVA